MAWKVQILMGPNEPQSLMLSLGTNKTSVVLPAEPCSPVICLSEMW